VSTWAYLDHPGPIAFAHRGGASEHPENTMPAFEHAVRLGYRYLETDAHATADGVLVAFHDDKLDRVTDRTGVIAQLPWETVRMARVSGESIPLMEDLLTAWPDVRVNIDLKHETSVGPLVDAINRTATHDRVCVASFSGKRLDRFRAMTDGRVCTAIGPLDIARLRVASYLGRPATLPGACVQVPVRQAGLPIVDRRFVDGARRSGLPVHVWTVSDEAEMDRLLDLGVDGIMTDRPTLLKEVLARRGQWA
jgi:glycerophosphoryl diester phosphodiesterase